MKYNTTYKCHKCGERIAYQDRNDHSIVCCARYIMNFSPNVGRFLPYDTHEIRWLEDDEVLAMLNSYDRHLATPTPSPWDGETAAELPY